jgi:hypothetical protein
MATWAMPSRSGQLLDLACNDSHDVEGIADHVGCHYFARGARGTFELLLTARI